MLDIIVMGEMLVEIMREQVNMPLDEQHVFLGPFPSGAPAIFIDTAARLGCRTAIVGGVGIDDFGKCLLRRLRRDGVDCSGVVESAQRSTGVAFVTYFSDGSRKFIFHMGNTPAVEARSPEDPEPAGYMHIMGCSLMADRGFAREILKLMHKEIEMGARISFDPNIRKELFTDDSFNTVVEEVMRHTSIFMPGVSELLLTTGCGDVDSAVRKCFTYPKMELVVLKNGSRGSTLYTVDGPPLNVGVCRVTQVDATGAGDCYDGAFLAGLCHGETLKKAAEMGAAAGALNAAAFGPMEGKIDPYTVGKMMEQNF